MTVTSYAIQACADATCRAAGASERRALAAAIIAAQAREIAFLKEWLARHVPGDAPVEPGHAGA